MLKLRQMKLTGFKSFFQKTELHFTDGITAVVGPNGCGKSNISDAISWVLGEQSSKSLRGSKMEDVIFNGSEKRGPLPMAEVTLTLAWNANGHEPGNGNGHLASGAGTGDAGAGSGAAADAETEFAPRPGVLEAARAATGPEAGDAGSEGNGHAAAPTFTLPTEEGAEVHVTRRLFRNGESEYRIDGRRVRLRDVQDLMQAARIGSRTYAVIEQDRISALLSARPKERKEMIEEAAGILGIKARKRAALLKLEHTETNLARLRDLVSEITRQANSLKRQAAKARRYRRTAEEIRRQRRILFHREHAALGERLGRLEAEFARLSAEQAQAAAHVSRQDAVVEGLRQRIDEDGRGAGDRRDELHAMEREVDRLDGALQGLAQRLAEAADLGQRRSREAGDLRQRAREARQQGEGGAARRAEAATELTRHQEELAGLESRYTERLAAADDAARAAESDRARLLEAVARLGEARNVAHQLAERGSRLAAQRQRLERERQDCAAEESEVTRRMEGMAARLRDQSRAADEAEASCQSALASRDGAARAAEAAREALAAARRELHAWSEREAALASLWHAARQDGDGASGAGCSLGEGVEVDPRWEAAAGAWAEGLLQARIIDDVPAALAAVRQARERGEGRIRLVVPGLVPAVLPGREQSLSGVLAGEGQRAALLAALSGDPLLVGSLEEAVERWRREPGRACLTPEGDGITATGLIVGGHRGESSGLLACNRQRREAAEAAAACQAKLPALEQAAEAARQHLASAESGAEAARVRREELTAQAMESRLLRERLAEEQQRVARRREVLEAEEELLAQEEAAQRRDAEQAGAAEETADGRRLEAEAAAAASQERLDTLRQEIHQLAGERAERKSEVAARRESLAALEQELSRLTAEAADLEERAEACAAESEDLGRRGETMQAERAGLARQKEEAAEKAAVLRERCRADEMSLAESRAALGGAEAAARDLRSTLEEARERTRAGELDKARAAADMDHLERECREEFACEPSALAEGLTPEELQADPETIRAEVARLQGIQEKLGPVNMMALEQFAEVEEREKFLAAQQQDVEESIRSLKATIARIDHTARERFQEALEAIRGEFGRLFRELFDGGVADIELQDPEDILESGVDIIAQPPGKRTRNINLLSGGEKALSAIALLFAIFNYKPSPFCLLDEVDAALDEANVERFTRLLRRYGGGTQFILITHNRRSMEVADVMYGVTMEEPGVSQTVSLKMA